MRLKILTPAYFRIGWDRLVTASAISEVLYVLQGRIKTLYSVMNIKKYLRIQPGMSQH